MRRGLLIMILLAAAVVPLSLLLQQAGRETAAPRCHQHLTQPSEEELGPCPRCGGEETLCTHLPVINVETGGQTIPGRPIRNAADSITSYQTGDHGETEIVVSYSTVSEAGVWHHPDDEPTLTGTALFRFRGNSSRYFTKGSYRMRLVKDDGEQKRKQGLLGMPAGTDWALYGPFLDKTLLRNYMCMNLSAEVMGTWTPEVRFCELMLDGEYQGVYVLMEMIDVDANRLSLTEYRSGDPVCSYLVLIGSRSKLERSLDNFCYYTYQMEIGRDLRAEVLYPRTSSLSQQVLEYIQADFSEVERMLFSSDLVDGTSAWKSEINMDSFVNYYILMEFLAVNDMFGNSTYLYRDVRGKLSIGPVWDYNNVLDNFFHPMPARSFLLSQRGWYSRLMMDREFVERVIRRYRELRRGVLSEEHLLAYEKAVETWLGSAIARNYTVWGYTFDPEQVSAYERRFPAAGSGDTLQDVNPDSYRQAVEWMLDYMVNRGRWMDEHIETLRQYSHPSRFATQVLE